jgi:16S rRNA (adenine1518-N6/adenine1519-N6)-dimethyltransferase
MTNIRPRRSLGQNFLVDPNIARKIVGSLRAPRGGRVVEIGSGTGALTGVLLSEYPDVLAVEIDERAIDYLQSEYPGLDVRHADVLDLDWALLAASGTGPLFVIGNLPYHITSPILFSLLDNASVFAEAVLMMQLEVAQRLTAQPRSRSYGILSVATQLTTDVELLFRVSRNVFRPRPDVTSAVVRLTFPQSGPRVEYSGRLKEVVRSAFNQRRKQLRNSLSAFTRSAGRELPDRWAGKRAEELAPEEFVEVARYLTPAS